jgi:signal transduction histidine kinase
VIRLRHFNPLSWPLALKAPLLVAVLMFAVSAVITKQVLSRLEDSQQRNLQQLTSAYLDGLSSALIPAMVREDVWEAFDTLDRSRAQYRSLNVNWTVVVGSDGRILAATDPIRFPTQSPAPDQSAAASPAEDLIIDPHLAVARFSRDMMFQDRRIGTILAEADIASLLAERRDVFWTLILTNLTLTILLAIVGFALVRRMTRPMAFLTALFETGRKGAMETVPDAAVASQSGEFKQLFRGYNALVKAVNEREVLAVQLAEEEKVASLGRLASGMAHEINNPLGGMFNALDALRRHGEHEHVRLTSHRLIEQGLSGIRDLVRSTLATYRADRPLRDLTASDLDDLRLLIKPEAKLRGLNLEWTIGIDSAVAAPAVPIRDAALNLLLNACHVSREGGTVTFTAALLDGHVVLDIGDAGEGLPDHIREYIERLGAGAAPLDRRSGLGLWIVKRLCDEMRGKLQVVSTGSTGTVIRLLVPHQDKDLRNAA